MRSLLTNFSIGSSFDLVERFIEIGDDMEAIEHVKRLRDLLGDHLEVWLPHIRTDVA